MRTMDLGLDFVAAEGADIAAVAQHGDALGQFVDLRHAVGDVDDGETFGLQPEDDLEQLLGLAAGQGGGRLVHHQDAGALVDGAGDLHHLLFGDRQVAHQSARAEGGAEAAQDVAAAGIHGGAVDHKTAARFAAEIDVFGDGQVRRERQFLVDDGDAVGLGRKRAVDLHGLAVDLDLGAGIGDVGAGEDLHQRGFAGAVLTHQRMDLAGVDGKLDVAQRLHAGEGLGDVLHAQYRRGIGRCRHR